LTIEVRTKGALTNLLRSFGGSLTLLDHLVDGQSLPEQPLPLRGLDSRTTDLRIANHHDGKALGLSGLGIRSDHGVLDGRERREQLADLLDLDALVQIPDVDLEHRHE
jgi:hypothetical protein